jgi:hypothetical protein
MSKMTVEKRANTPLTTPLTTPLACLMLTATILTSPVMTSTANQDVFINRPDAILRPDTILPYITGTFNSFTSTVGVMSYERVQSPKYAAYELFGEMRSSTDEEMALFEDMLERLSMPLDVDIFSL